ncbi:MAG: tRNA lysidine(34) synthetase TilS [Oscillospiraceae bacterium]
MMTRVYDFCMKYAMLPPSSRVLCAVSGGADSMAMLYILLELSKKQGFFISCAHYNHGIRGREALRDEKFVVAECEKLGIPLKVGRGNVPAFAEKNGLGTEEAARMLRYAFLESAADELGCDRIATAHNASDNAETVLMNLLRGAGLRGVCGISPVRGRIIRPLLCLDRPEIISYLEEHDIAHVEDATNESDDYMRNRIRHRVIAPLREISLDFGEKILSACETMREDDECLDNAAKKFLRSQGAHISAAALSALPKPIAARCVMYLVPSAEKKHIEAVLELAGGSNAHGRLSIPGTEVLKQYDDLCFDMANIEPIPEKVIRPGETIETKRYIFSCRTGVAEPRNNSESYFFCFKIEKICGNIRLGTRQTGDTLRQKNRGITKSLKKLFSEAKIPPTLRATVPVFRDDTGLLGVYGFGEDERAAALPGDASVIIEIVEKGVEEDFEYER